MSSSGQPSYDDVQLDLRSVVAAIWSQRLRIVLVSVVLMAITFLVLLLVPRQYVATSAILVEARDSPFTRATIESGPGSGASPDDATIESEIQLIRSRETLKNVVEIAGLRDEPEYRTGGGLFSFVGQLIGGTTGADGNDGTARTQSSEDRLLAIVADRLSAVREGGSRLISISYTSKSPELSARVANTLAQAHVRRRADLVLQDTGEASVWLEREVASLRGKVAEAEGRVAAYKVDKDLFVGSANTALVEQQMSAISAQISGATERRSTAETKSRLIREMIAKGQAVEAIPDVRASPVVQRLAEQKATLMSSRAQSSATLLPDHPTMKALNAQITDFSRQIRAEGARIADAFNAEGEIEADLEKSLREELARLKVTASSAEIDGVKLADLEREATAQRDLLAVYLSRYREAAARVSGESAFTDVRIVSSAAIPRTPSFPQVNLMVAMAGFLALVIQCGTIAGRELARGNVLVNRGSADNGPRYEDREQDDAPSRQAPEAPPAQLKMPSGGVRSEENRRSPASSNRATGATGTAGAGLSANGIAAHILDSAAPVAVFMSAEADDAHQPGFEMVASALVGRGASVVVIYGAPDQAQAQAQAYDDGTPGLTDLAAGMADFGDVVKIAPDNGSAVVGWGTLGELNSGAREIPVLLEALREVFDHVLIAAGAPDAGTAPELFVTNGAILCVGGRGDVDDGRMQALRERARELGFSGAVYMRASEPVPEVA
ncbi:MAG: GumC family protein [Alphaproteobacteria bacterium]|nr:GumC family protein [Alphaproteobacteria bacterium]